MVCDKYLELETVLFTAWAAPAFFVLGAEWGQTEGHRGGHKTRAGASLSEVNPPNTPVKPTQNIRFNEHLPHFLFANEI